MAMLVHYFILATNWPAIGIFLLFVVLRYVCDIISLENEQKNAVRAKAKRENLKIPRSVYGFAHVKTCKM